jgi:hypothetical protein
MDCNKVTNLIRSSSSKNSKSIMCHVPFVKYGMAHAWRRPDTWHRAIRAVVFWHELPWTIRLNFGIPIDIFTVKRTPTIHATARLVDKFLMHIVPFWKIYILDDAVMKWMIK